MFLKFIKDFSVKKLLKKSLNNVKPALFLNSVQNIGILIDESYFDKKELLFETLTKYNIQKSNIKLLLYKDKITKNEVFNYPIFTLKDINWSGHIQNNLVTQFTMMRLIC